MAEVWADNEKVTDRLHKVLPKKGDRTVVEVDGADEEIVVKNIRDHWDKAGKATTVIVGDFLGGSAFLV